MKLMMFVLFGFVCLYGAHCWKEAHEKKPVEHYLPLDFVPEYNDLDGRVLPPKQA